MWLVRLQSCRMMAQQSSTTDDLKVSVIEQEELCLRRLEAAEEVVARWGSQGSSACGSSELVAAVRELLSLSSDGGAYGHRAEAATQKAIAHLEDEFRHVLITGTNLHTPDNLVSPHDNIVLDRSFSFSSFPNLEAQSFSSFSTTPTSDSQTHCTGFSRDSISMEQVYMYLIDPEAAIVLKEIAELIILAGHAPNVCHVYSETRHNLLMECLYLLGIQTDTIHSSPEVTSEGRYNMQLDGRKVKLWIKGLRVIVGTVLSEERQACAQIFGCDKMVEQDCFTRATIRCTKQLLAFGSTIARVNDHHYEKVPLLLQMHEELAKLQPSLQVMLFDDSMVVICQEISMLLGRLREASLSLLSKFSKLQFDYNPDNKIALNGSILSLTVIIMAFLKLLAEHCDSLNLILPLKEEVATKEGGIEKSILPWERYVLGVLSRLQLKIVEKSESYKDKRLRYIFLMNNAMYVLEYARTSVLKMPLRDDWIHQHLGLQVEQYATAYFRASWSTALGYFEDRKAQKFTPHGVKENFKNFNSTFEEIIRVQTTWKVPNPQLRQHLRIIILEHVLPAYRAYCGRYGSLVDSGHYSGRYIKYTPEDIENHVLDLFEG